MGRSCRSCHSALGAESRRSLRVHCLHYARVKAAIHTLGDIMNAAVDLITASSLCRQIAQDPTNGSFAVSIRNFVAKQIAPIVQRDCFIPIAAL